MSAFMCSIQATNSPRSRGRSGSRTRWTITPSTSSSGGRLLAPAREHVHVDVLRGEVLGQLAHVPREAALDQRRVLPGEDQDAHQGEVSGARSRSGARLRTAGSGTAAESARAPSAASSSRRGREPLARVVAGQVAGDHGRPSRSPGAPAARARRAPGPRRVASRARRRRRTVRSSRARARRRRGRRRRGESQVDRSLALPQVEGASGALDGLDPLEPLAAA